MSPAHLHRMWPIWLVKRQLHGFPVILTTTRVLPVYRHSARLLDNATANAKRTYIILFVNILIYTIIMPRAALIMLIIQSFCCTVVTIVDCVISRRRAHTRCFASVNANILQLWTIAKFAPYGPSPLDRHFDRWFSLFRRFHWPKRCITRKTEYQTVLANCQWGLTTDCSRSCDSQLPTLLQIERQAV